MYQKSYFLIYVYIRIPPRDGKRTTFFFFSNFELKIVFYAFQAPLERFQQKLNCPADKIADGQLGRTQNQYDSDTRTNSFLSICHLQEFSAYYVKGCVLLMPRNVPRLCQRMCSDYAKGFALIMPIKPALVDEKNHLPHLD